MKALTHIGGAVLSSLGLMWCTCVAVGQTPRATMPASQPTGRAADTPALYGAATASNQTRETAEPQHLKVTWAADTLTIAAEDAGLNQILREISRRTGMKVTGGVADERVYGSYGPGPAEIVLTGLLSGIKSNMLLKEATADHPMELILSPRLGGPSSPGPSTYGSGDDREDSAPARPSSYDHGRLASGAPELRGPQNAEAGVTEAQGVRDGSQEPASLPATPSASVDTSAGDTPSPSEAKSPQEIYDQLIKLQQQRNSSAGAATSPQ